MGPVHVEVLWVSEELRSAERCVISARPGQGCLDGVAVLALRDVPACITYRVDTQPDWTASKVRFDMAAGADSLTRVIECIDGAWSVDGEFRTDLDACTSLDLGWTPATNTLPLRAVDLTIDESMRSTAAWVRFPELDVVPSEQTYTRLAHDRVRYQSATFSADLVVSADDVVVHYGDGLWTATAMRRCD